MHHHRSVLPDTYPCVQFALHTQHSYADIKGFEICTMMQLRTPVIDQNIISKAVDTLLV